MLLLFGAGSVHAAEPITTCTTISDPGDYVLAADLSSDETCIQITASDVTLDGDGFTIEGEGEEDAYGIQVGSAVGTLSNVVIENVTLTEWHYGIRVEGVDDATITGVTSNNFVFTDDFLVPLGIGIGIYDSASAVLTDNVIDDNTAHGITLSESPDAHIEGNVVEWSTAAEFSTGILVTQSDDVEILDNTIEGNSWGIGLAQSDRALVEGNLLASNWMGTIEGFETSESVFTDNVVESNFDGILLFGGDDNEIVDNVITGTTRHGVDLHGTTNTPITDNVFENNFRSAVRLNDLGPGQQPGPVTANAFNDNDIGVEIVGSSLAWVFNNTFDGNDVGVEVVDGSSNTVTLNAFDGNGIGVSILDSRFNTVSHNELTGGSQAAVFLGMTDLPVTTEHNEIVDNHIAENRDGIFLLGSENVVENNTIVDQFGTGFGLGLGLHIHDFAIATHVENNTIERNGGGGIFAEGAGNVILDNQINENGLTGLTFGRPNNATANTITHNDGHGIMIQSGFTVRHNVVKHNNASGIVLAQAGGGEIAENLVVGHEDGLRMTNQFAGDFVDNVIADNDRGVVVRDSAFTTVANNTLLNNTDVGIETEFHSPWGEPGGIFPLEAQGNVFVDNVVLHSEVGIVAKHNDSVVQGNHVANVSSGIKHLGRIRPTFDIFEQAHNATVADNVVENVTDRAILVDRNTNVTVANNHVTGGTTGLVLLRTHASTVTDNTLVGQTGPFGGIGLDVFASSDNLIVGTVAVDADTGVFLEDAAGNTLTGSDIFNHATVGIRLVGADTVGNLLYDNFLVNDVNVEIDADVGMNAWNVDVEPGANVLGGDVIGGNAWLDPDGTGHSETCTDRGDGICEEPLTIDADNVDAHPLVFDTGPTPTPTPEPEPPFEIPEELPGFGVALALVALVLAVVALRRRA